MSRYNAARAAIRRLVTRCRNATTRPGRRVIRRTTRREARACVAIQTLYRDRGAAARRYSPRVRVTTRQNMPATWPGGGHDTTLYAPRHDTQRALCARPGRSGRATWVRVCTWCTQPNFDSVHGFESLFMSTVHEV